MLVATTASVPTNVSCRLAARAICGDRSIFTTGRDELWLDISFEPIEILLLESLFLLKRSAWQSWRKNGKYGKYALG